MSGEKPDEFLETQQPFSDLMLRWLAEGDVHPTAADDQSAATKDDGSGVWLTRLLGRTRETQRLRILLASAALVSLGVVLGVHHYADRRNASSDNVSVTIQRPAHPMPVQAPSRISVSPTPEAAAPAAVAAAANDEDSRSAHAGPSPHPSDPAAAVALGEPGPGSVISSESVQRDSLRDCQAAVNRERPRAALRECAAAVSEAPDSAPALVLLARANLLGGQEGKSLRLAQRALTIDTQLSDAYLVVGSAQQTAGKPEDARSAYEAYLRLAPKGRHAVEVRAVLKTL